VLTRAQGCGDVSDNASGFAFDLLVREAQDGVAELPEVEIASVIVLEGDRAAVVEERVGFHHHALLAPEEVDLEAAELDVGLGGRQLVAADECEEIFLEV
jgi:hypothetical protein